MKIQNNMSPQLDPQKLAALPTGEQHLTEKYGARGTASRTEFEAKAKAWHYAEVLKNARKDANMTQKQLADKIGKKREYISQLEKGDIDMQLSMFILISEALGLRYALTL